MSEDAKEKARDDEMQKHLRKSEEKYVAEEIQDRMAHKPETNKLSF